MITQEQIDTFIEKIKNAESIVILAHKNPDGDAMCSVAAMARLLELNFDKQPVCVYDGNIPDNLDNVPLRKRLRYYERLEGNPKFDVAIVMDYGIARNIGGPYKFVETAKYVIEIDHHINDNKIGDLCIDNEKAAATVEIVYELMKRAGWVWDNALAVLLMTGLITDTGYFKYVNNGDTMRVAGDLVDADVNIQRIVNVLANKPRKTILTEAACVANAEFYYKNTLAVATITHQQYKNLDGRGDTALNLLGQITGVDYIVLLKEQRPDQIGVSLRGRFKPVDKVAVALGGGGHEFAAGAVVHDTLENVKAKIITLFKDVIK